MNARTLTDADKVVAALAERQAMSPLVHPLPCRPEPKTLSAQARTFVAYILPAGLPMRRIELQAINKHEANGLARATARALFPRRPFTTSARPA